MIYHVCTPKYLPAKKAVRAASRAIEINPANQPNMSRLGGFSRSLSLNKSRAAIVIEKYWGVGGVHLTVGFMDGESSALRKRILSHMNAWSKTGNVSFVESNVDPQVRIARVGGEDGGYWSYIGTDVLEIPKNQQTMNLEGFTMATPESEFHRVVRHETGHTLGMEHEHMRRQLVNKIDKEKAIKFFMATQGWSRDEVIAQVLTPLEDSRLMKTARADSHSVMCYQIPGELTKSGKPIIGGKDIDKSDFKFIGSKYPKPHSITAPKKKTAKRKPATKKMAKRK